MAAHGTAPSAGSTEDQVGCPELSASTGSGAIRDRAQETDRAGYVNRRLVDARNGARLQQPTTQPTLAGQHYLERVVFIGGAEDVVGLLDFLEREVVGA